MSDFRFAGVSAWRLCWPALHLVNRRMWDWRCWTALTGQLVQSPKVSCAKWKGHVSHSCYASFLVSVHQALRRSPLGMVERDTSEEGRCVSWLDAARKCQWFHCFQLCHVVPNSGKLCLDSVSFSTCMSTPEGIPRVLHQKASPSPWLATSGAWSLLTEHAKENSWWGSSDVEWCPGVFIGYGGVTLRA